MISKKISLIFAGVLSLTLVTSGVACSRVQPSSIKVESASKIAPGQVDSDIVSDDSSSDTLAAVQPDESTPVPKPVLPQSQEAVAKIASTKEIMVKYKDSSDLANIVASNKGAIKANNTRLKVASIEVAKGSSISSEVETYGKDSQVQYAEPNFKMKASFVPNDPDYSSQWALPDVKAPDAWNVASGNSDIMVAVMDTGVNASHPDLSMSVVQGYNSMDGSANTADDNGHGTHVAGIVAAINNNGKGIASIGGGSKILPVKVLDSTGSGYVSDIANGITWAVDNYQSKGGKRLIINLSLGSPQYSQTLQDAINYASSHGVLVVAAAGNENTSVPDYPAASSNVLAVAAVGQNNNKAPFSNYGGYIDIAAPGVNILSTTYDGRYGYMSGTSMASPMIAGAAALLWGTKENLTAQQIESALENSAQDLGQAGKDSYYGYGLLDINKAVLSVTGANPTSSPTTSPAPPAQEPSVSPVNITISRVVSSPSVFSPNRGRGKLSYVLSSDANVTVNVISEDGQVVRVLTDNKFLSSGEHSAVWDGKNGSGAIVTDASYRFVVNASYQGISANTGSASITVDTKPPVVSDITASENPFLTYKQSSISFKFELSEDSNVAAYIENGNRIPVKILAGPTQMKSGTNTLTWDGKANSGSRVPNGTYSLVLKAADSLGNTSEPYICKISVDNGAPSISNVNVYSKPFKNFSYSYVTYNLSGNLNASVKVYDRNNIIVATLFNGAQNGGVHQIIWNGNDSNGRAVSGGTYILKIEAADSLGNAAETVTRNFTVAYKK